MFLQTFLFLYMLQKLFLQYSLNAFILDILDKSAIISIIFLEWSVEKCLYMLSAKLLKL